MGEFFKKIFRKEPQMRSNSQQEPEPSQIPTEDTKTRIARLKQEAQFRRDQGGDAELEQTQIELVAMAMTIVREDEELTMQQVADLLNVTKLDYNLAEGAILEPEKFFELLPEWLELYGYDQQKFMEDLDARSRF